MKLSNSELVSSIFRLVCYIGAIICVTLTIYRLLINSEDFWQPALIFFGLAVIARIDVLSEFKFSVTGFEAKLQKKIEQANATIEQLQRIAKTQSKAAVSLVFWSNKMAGLTRRQKYEFRAEIAESLKSIGLSDGQISEISEDATKITRWDLAYDVMRRTQEVLPQADKKDFGNFWNTELGSPDDQPSYRKIYEKINKIGVNDDELNELLKDLKHFDNTKTLRRPDIFLDKE